MNKTRKLGWIATATLLGAALLAPSIVTANTGHQSGSDIAWNDPDFQGSDEDCANADLAPGEVLWHFVQTQVADGITSGKLSGTITEGAFGPIASYKKSGGVLHWQVITGQTTLLTFMSDVTSDGNLNLSHICVGPELESESPSASLPVETESPSASMPVETESPSGSVEAETGTPQVTPPSTDSVSGDSSSTGTGLQLLLLGLGALTATALVVKPSRKRR
ncbi:MAG: hypothetical protein ABIR11_05985 [Candidatus Limnocylindrales bacterium]